MGYSFFLSLSFPPSLPPPPSHRYICPGQDGIHSDSARSGPLPQVCRKAALTGNLHVVLKKQTPCSPPAPSQGSSCSKPGEKIHLPSSGRCEGGMSLRIPMKLWRDGGKGVSRPVLARKSPFSGKKNNKERNQPISPRCHHLFLVIFQGRSGRVAMATDASSSR